MQASTDGTVPPHLLDRLRQLEAPSRRPASEPRPTGSGQSGAKANPHAKVRQGKTRLGRPDPRLASQESDLYTAFQQLLLEDEDDL